jgi:pimeloyl-ACP methyl ester carboxylesterase
MNTTTSASRAAAHAPAPRKKGLLFWTRRVFIGLGLVLVALAAIGAIFQAVATAIDKRTYAPPGQLVDVGGHRMHIHCMGSGSPTVILDASSGNTSASWGLIQPEVAKRTRVCTYDRAGLGWSDQTTAPRDARQIARDLHALLGAAGIAGPYVLVGHSSSGVYAQLYAADYPAEVAGMVLVDTMHPDQFRPLSDGTPPNQTLENAQLVVDTVYSPITTHLGLKRLIAALLFKDLPAPRRGATIAHFATVAAGAVAQAELRAAFTDNPTQARSARDLGARPLIVLTAEQEGPYWLERQRQLAALSSNHIHRIVTGADHFSLAWGRKDAPVTSTAILQVVEAVRSGQPLTESYGANQ